MAEAEGEDEVRVAAAAAAAAEVGKSTIAVAYEDWKSYQPKDGSLVLRAGGSEEVYGLQPSATSHAACSCFSVLLYWRNGREVVVCR